MHPLIALTAPHGITDAFLHPPLVLLGTHASAVGISASLTENQRLAFLVVPSIAHMRHDFAPLGKRASWGCSLALHALWAHAPDLAPLYLGVVHTPMHYARAFPRIAPPARKRAGLAVAALTIAALAWADEVGVYAFDAMWVAPVVAHIALHEFVRRA
tara:strand:- start:1741 stop:2214 length:474 start_codon:yes stop_codon:yes gene_type:complete